MAEKKKIATGYIGNALRSSAADHTTTFTDEVFDTERQKYQSEVNAGIEERIETEKNRAEAAEKAIIFDVSENNNGTVFESLQSLLSSSNLSTLIPTSVRCGGMSIRFVQSSDNKYVQYRLTNQNWSIEIVDWQEIGSVEFSTGEKVSETSIDDEPTDGSDNLVKSGGVYKHTNKLEEQVKEINSKRELSYDAIELIKTILSNAVFVSDQQSNIEELYKELESGGGVVKTPVITLNNNVCTITCKTENTTIRYTINGVSPSMTIGTVYSASFPLDESCTIKTIAYTPEGNISKIVTKDYELSVDYIVFADAEVERVCLVNFDSDGDGKISFEEAANVTSISRTFRDNTTITKFHELKYFGITNLSYCFSNTSSLVSVTLPSHLKTISVAAFNNSAIRFINTENIESVEQTAFTNCVNLENVNLDNCRDIAASAFEKCTNMTLHSDELTLSSIGGRAFYSCANLNLRKISGTISEIQGSTFFGCTSITELELGEIQSIGNNSFGGCTSLTKVKITGSTVPTIQSSSFPNTTVFYVPASMVSAYANAEVWNTIYNNGRIKPIND